jgi:hypothetical protein
MRSVAGMRSVSLRMLLVVLVALYASGCRLIEGVFKAGVGVGIALSIGFVVLIVAVIWAMLRGGSST